MLIVAIDPGTTKSAVVTFDGLQVLSHAIHENEWLVRSLGELGMASDAQGCVLVIEGVEAMGMAVGREVFETVFWSGRMVQAWPYKWERVTRRQVKLHLCGSMKAKDTNIRQALLDRFGGREKALGTKRAPGPMYKVISHEIAALAVAVTFYDAEVDRREFKEAR